MKVGPVSGRVTLNRDVNEGGKRATSRVGEEHFRWREEQG